MKNELSVEDFIREFQDFMESLQTRVVSKSNEYSAGADAFANFNSALQLDPSFKDIRIVLHGYLLKHLTSYFQMIEDIKYHVSEPSVDYSAEKLGDIIVYMAILHIMNKNVQNQIEVDLPF